MSNEDGRREEGGNASTTWLQNGRSAHCPLPTAQSPECLLEYLHYLDLHLPFAESGLWFPTGTHNEGTDDDGARLMLTMTALVMVSIERLEKKSLRRSAEDQDVDEGKKAWHVTTSLSLPVSAYPNDSAQGARYFLTR